MSRKAIVTLCALASLAPAATGSAAPGDFDRSFDGDGRALIDVGLAVSGEPDRYDYANGVAVQEDGKIVLVGAAAVEPASAPHDDDWVVIRLLPGGELDPDFGTGGIVTTDLGNGNEAAEDVFIQEDGKIVVVGQTHGPSNATVAVRYTDGGDPDDSFGDEGVFRHDMPGSDFGHAVAAQGSGFVIVGRFESPDYDSFVMRVTGDGDLDTEGFGTDGVFTTDFGGAHDWAHDVAVQENGKIVVAGTSNYASVDDADVYVMRLNEGGTLDDTSDGSGFGGDGVATADWGDKNDHANAVVLGSDGTIYAGGLTHPDGGQRNMVIASFTAAGEPNESWSGDGKVTTSFPGPSDDGVYDLEIDPKGRVLAVSFGNGEGFKLARYLRNGNLDDGFGGDGRVIRRVADTQGGSARAMALTSTGRIVVAGSAHNGTDNDFAVARLTVAKGTTETTLSIDKNSDRVKATGTVKPKHAGEDVIVKLFKKVDGEFAFAEKEDAELNADGRYSTRFDRVNRQSCKIVARFPGDAHHKASTASEKFTC